jgi:hypothetical protein
MYTPKPLSLLISEMITLDRFIRESISQEDRNKFRLELELIKKQIDEYLIK